MTGIARVEQTARGAICGLALLLLGAWPARAQQRSEATVPRISRAAAEAIAQRVLRTHPIIDGHADLYRYYLNCAQCPRDLGDYPLDRETPGTIDLPKWRRGGVGGQLYNVYGKDREVVNLLGAFDLMHRMAERYPNDIRIVGSAEELEEAARAGRIGIVPMFEGAVLLQNDPALLRTYHRLGLRAVTLAYRTNDLADGSDDVPRHGGISPLGRAMIAEMNRIGVIVDLSHVSPDAMRAALAASTAPVIFSHSNAYALCKVGRNVPDDVLRALRANGGVIMINFVPYHISQRHADWLTAIEAAWRGRLAQSPDTAAADRYLETEWRVAHPEPRVTIGEVADHIDYVKRLIGVEHVGLGADFGNDAEFIIPDLADAGRYPALLAELAMRGWTEAELGQLTRGNFLRVFRAVGARAGTR